MNKTLKKEYDFSVKDSVRKAFETALIVAEEFESEYVKTSHFLIGLIKSNNTALYNYFIEFGLILNADIVAKTIMSSPSFFEELYGEEEMEKFFYPSSDEEEKEFKEEESKKKAKKENLDEYIADAVKKALHEEKMEAQLMEEIESYIPDLNVYYSKDLVKLLNDTITRLQNLKIDVIDADNMLYTMLKMEDCSGYKLLSRLLETTDTKIEEFNTFLENECSIMRDKENLGLTLPSSIEGCCEIFNDRFEKGKISEILGRDKEKQQLWNIFSKKTKRNAILVGSAGVGKTAIIEAITQDIINETCPKKFKGYIVLSFDVGASVAGTKYRGEFEQKISTLKKFLERNKNVILFIDEIHSTVGVGATEGNSNDLSGALKSILARSDVIVVGTTTYEEYDRFIARDIAYKRRFERVNVCEPKYSEVKKMVKLKVAALEQFHGVKMSSNVLDYIITTSACFSSSSSNPDKSLDLCDRAMAIAESSNSSKVTRKHVQRVFEDSYEKFKKIDECANEMTAYHEAAHYVVSKVTGFEEKENIIAVSILPTTDSLGVNILESNESVVIYTKQDYLDKITVLLAGRAVEILKFHKLGTGAEGDIMHATSIAKSLIVNRSLEFSLSDYKSHISPIFYDEKGNEILKLDEKTKVKVNEAVSKILDDQFKVSKEFVDIFLDRIEAIAKALLSKYVLTRDELDKIYSKNASKKNKKETLEVRLS